ncbi:hypothetical protein GEMRC1_011208 [Eukaryota sp. GEM-RC1]
MNEGKDVDLELLSEMSGQSTTTAINETIAMLKPYYHPSLLYCTLFSQFLFDNGVCTKTQSVDLHSATVKTIQEIDTTLLYSLSAIPLTIHVFNVHGEELIIPGAVPLILKLTQYWPDSDPLEAARYVFLYPEKLEEVVS